MCSLTGGKRREDFIVRERFGYLRAFSVPSVITYAQSSLVEITPRRLLRSLEAGSPHGT